ncbi:hypothetical protein BGZ65_005811 [Modicella reniformis]|uniref:F-box domain-containing protein n=1 Tax=Modicella reniformis TaxID=1440133 RepID=A0A9P6IQ33_9FUNG|nr:hypothetical protein BGZ65_005811 [Modicella reniformis]
MERNPLNLPEILEVISQYLWRPDRARCLLVSRLFYSVMVPRVWRKIVLEPPTPSYRGSIAMLLRSELPKPSYPTGEALEHHKHHIQELEFRGEYPSEYFSLVGCSQLRTLGLSSWILTEHLPADKAIEKMNPAVMGLARLAAVHALNIRQVSICLTKDPMLTVTEGLWSALVQCSELEQLLLKNLTVPNECNSSFFKVCENVSSLSLISVKIPSVPNKAIDISEGIRTIDIENNANGNDDTGNFTLQGPRTITIVGPPYLQLMTLRTHQIDPKMVRACIHLESMTWRQHAEMGTGLESIPDWDDAPFCNDLSANPWPFSRLVSLDLSWTMVHDEALARVLSQLHKLKTLRAIRTGFGRASLHQLFAERWTSSGESADRLCDSIETLVVDMCTNLTGAMIQTILSSCRNLVVFSADKISIEDIARGKEWICTELQELRFFLSAEVHSSYQDSSPMTENLRMQRAAFAQLGQLTRLRILYLTYIRRSERTRMKTLHLRVESGLELLTGLKYLRELYFQGDDSQKLGVEEAAWMVENWPQLRKLRGSVNEDLRVLEQMKSVLFARQISFH